MWPITVALVTIFMLYRMWNLGIFGALLGIGPEHATFRHGGAQQRGAGSSGMAGEDDEFSEF